MCVCVIIILFITLFILISSEIYDKQIPRFNGAL